MAQLLNKTLKEKMYRSQILYLLHMHGALSQVDICKKLGLQKPAVSNIVNDAIKAGLIKKLGAEPEQRNVPGAKPVLLGLDNRKSVVLGLSIREKCFYSGLVNFHGEVFNAQCHKLDNFKWEDLAEIVTRAISDARKSKKNVLGVGLAVGGYFIDKNKSLHPDNKYFKFPIDLPLLVDDYPNAAAVMELLFGQAKGKDSFAFLQLGESHRVSCYNNGKIVRGIHGLAGEVSAVEIIKQDTYKSPFYSYKHCKIEDFKTSSLSEIEENAYFLANMLIQIMVYYDPRQIIIAGMPSRNMA